MQTTFPSPLFAHRRLDLIVHVIGLGLILTAAGVLWTMPPRAIDGPLALALAVYVLCALASNLASMLYHFSRQHDQRTLLRRIDHAAIYPSISGTFTPFFVLANTSWTLTLLWICWGLTFVAMWNKITNPTVKSRWSTASYLGLGAIGLSALPDLTMVPVATLWCIIGGAFCYVCGTVFYARKSMPYRYAIWHSWVNAGGILMFIGVWIAIS